MLSINNPNKQTSIQYGAGDFTTTVYPLNRSPEITASAPQITVYLFHYFTLAILQSFLSDTLGLMSTEKRQTLRSQCDIQLRKTR